MYTATSEKASRHFENPCTLSVCLALIAEIDTLRTLTYLKKSYLVFKSGFHFCSLLGKYLLYCYLHVFIQSTKNMILFDYFVCFSWLWRLQSLWFAGVSSEVCAVSYRKQFYLFLTLQLKVNVFRHVFMNAQCNLCFPISLQGWIQDERVLEEATQKVALLYQNYRWETFRCSSAWFFFFPSVEKKTCLSFSTQPPPSYLLRLTYTVPLIDSRFHTCIGQSMVHLSYLSPVSRPARVPQLLFPVR